MKIIAFILVLVGLIVGGALAVLRPENADPRPPQRPAKVPVGAVWSGGADGGHWFLMDQTPPSLNFSIFHDGTGELITQGTFLAEANSTCQTKGPVSLGDVIGYDGINIFLKNHCKLVPHGWISYPPDHKVKFDRGREISAKTPLH